MPDGRLDDPDWLEEQYWGECRSTYDIGRELGCPAREVLASMKRNGIERRGAPDGRLDDPEWLEEKYWGEGLTLLDIADETGCSGSTVRNRLLEHGLGTREGAGPAPDVLDDEEWLREQYLGRGRTMDDIAGELGVGNTTVHRRLKSHGVPTRGDGAVDERLDDRDWLEEQYWGRGRSLRDIAADVDASENTVKRRLEEHGLGTRDGAALDDRLDDPEWLRESYASMTAEEMAAELGCAPQTVRNRMREHGIEPRRPGVPP